MKIFSSTFGSGQSLVLIHGWGMNHAVFSPLQANLGESFFTTLVDLPGHGKSEYQQGCLDPDVAANVIAAIIPDDSIVAGWSLGGAIATALERLHPKKVRATIYICSTPRFTQDQDWIHAVPAANFSAFGEQLTRNFKITLDTFMALQTMGAPAARDAISAIQKAVYAHGLPLPDALSEGLDVLMSYDGREKIRQSTKPAMWLFGEKDRIVMPNAKEWLAVHTTHKVVAYPEASHTPFATHQEDFISDLRAFAVEVGENNE